MEKDIVKEIYWLLRDAEDNLYEAKLKLRNLKLDQLASKIADVSKIIVEVSLDLFLSDKDRMRLPSKAKSEGRVG